MTNDEKRVGVIGGGQLAWMMVIASEQLPVKLIVQTPHRDDPAVANADATIFAEVDDAQATEKLAQNCDLVTFENEFVNLPALQQLAAQGIKFYPPLTALEPLLDKYDQRCYLAQLNLPVPQFSLPDAQANFLTQFPVVVKTRRHGYDGQGTFIVKSQEELAATLAKLAQVPVLIEEFVPFVCELAIIAARSVSGEIAIFPIVETQQINQVCQRVFAPATVSETVVQQAKAIATTLLNRLEVVGVFGIELFLTPDQQVLINEIAPRTHNSGHFTLDATETSQFEQHLRAVCNLPLGNPNLQCPGAVMVNLLGYETAQNDYLVKRNQLAQIPKAHVYWYGKNESRPGRKLGHVTVLLDQADQEHQVAIARKIESIWYPQI